MTSFRWAIVDIETTGLQVTYDSITEISVLIMTEQGIEATWHRLIKPRRSIPQAIILLNGISNEMLFYLQTLRKN